MIGYTLVEDLIQEAMGNTLVDGIQYIIVEAYCSLAEEIRDSLKEDICYILAKNITFDIPLWKIWYVF